jgi:hypothetical protein
MRRDRSTADPTNPTSLYIYLYILATGLVCLACSVKPAIARDVWTFLCGSTVSPALAAVVMAVAVCGSYAFLAVWAFGKLEYWRTQKALDSTRRTLAALRSGDDDIRAARNHAEPLDAWLPWPVFAKLLSVHKADTRRHGHPFTLLHLHKNGVASNAHGRLDGQHETPTPLFELLINCSIRSDDIASVSPSGDCFVLMPQTIYEVGQSFAHRMAGRSQALFPEGPQFEIRQFTFRGRRKSEARRVVGQQAAA